MTDERTRKESRGICSRVAFLAPITYLQGVVSYVLHRSDLPDFVTRRS
jgi:hypothetical protein